MKSLLISLYTVILLSVGFYARGACQSTIITQQHPNDIQVASVVNSDAQDAFAKLTARLNRGVK